ncbi:MAG TPA: glycoside hydrolase family 3 protein, partial [Blastocatellia bacterium]
MFRSLLALGAICLLFITGLTPALALNRADTSGAAATLAESHSESWADKTLKSMSVDEEIGQLIVPAMVGAFTDKDSDQFQDIARNIREFHVGGYHLLGDVNNHHDPAGIALLINHMQAMARVPLFITADFEGGVGSRFEGATRLPRGMAMGATRNEDLAYQAGKITAEEAKCLGFNVNFYPVVDVNNNPRNPIINIRSFGSDPNLVARMGDAYIRGSQGAGVLATAKHFPGHGDAATDSHLELPTIDVDRARLDSVELPPFRAAIKAGVGAIMSAHIALPQIAPGGAPATVSPKILTGLLRDELGFKGIIFTDAMNMQGVAAHYPNGEAAVKAVEAGADIVLFPPSVPDAFNALKQAVDSGAISRSRLDESVRRRLEAKDRLGIENNRYSDIDKIDSLLGTTAHQRMARQIIQDGITLVKNDGNTLPLSLNPNQTVLYISILDAEEGWGGGLPGRTFEADLLRRHPKTISVSVSDRTSPGEFALIRKLASEADVLIVGGWIRVAAFKGSIGLNEEQIDLIRNL